VRSLHPSVGIWGFRDFIGNGEKGKQRGGGGGGGNNSERWVSGSGQLCETKTRRVGVVGGQEGKVLDNGFHKGGQSRGGSFVGGFVCGERDSQRTGAPKGGKSAKGRQHW